MTNSPPSTPLPVAGSPCERSDAATNRQRILDAARQVLAADGADGLSMNAVAAAAGVGKGTIFRRFGDRDGLTTALLDVHTAQLQDAFLSGPPPLGPGAPPRERLEAFMRALLAFQDAHLEIMLAARRVEAGSPPVWGTFLLHVRTLLEQIDPTLDGTVIARLLLGATAPENLARLVREDGADGTRVAEGVMALLHGFTGVARRTRPLA